jgi:hypothetical protein
MCLVVVHLDGVECAVIHCKPSCTCEQWYKPQLLSFCTFVHQRKLQRWPAIDRVGRFGLFCEQNRGLRNILMTEHDVVLKLPDPLYQRVREMAEASNRTVELLLLESIDSRFRQLVFEGDLEAMLAGLAVYSDAQLWAVVQSRLEPERSARLHELADQSKQGDLPEAEQRELDLLLDLADRQMLMRSEALRLLNERGHDVAAYFKPIP